MQVILAPCNLGLSPLRPGHEPGAWQAPARLVAAGLLDAVRCDAVIEMPRPVYSPEAQTGTRLRNGQAIRAFNSVLADQVDQVCDQGDFALIIGGDCSILLGALAGARRKGRLSLVHIDGHSDFRHPGNYDAEQTLGGVAGMDLALATGRGEKLLTEWPGIVGPLVADNDVIQLGERECRDVDFAWPDIEDTSISRIDIFEALAIGPTDVIRKIAGAIERSSNPGFWIHFDVDVLDKIVMPAVDCPGSPGFLPQNLLEIIGPFVADCRCIGMTVTIFDPDLDPKGECAAIIIDLLARLPFRSRLP